MKTEYSAWLRIGLLVSIVYLLITLLRNSFLTDFQYRKLITYDFQNFLQNQSEPLNDKLLQRHKFKNIVNSIVCSEKTDLLITIISAVLSTERRKTIRSTWASVRTYGNFSIMHAFVLGQSSTLNTSIQRNIVEENSRHHDIIQGNFQDTYKTLPYKLTYNLHWIDSHCRHARYIVTVDDDVVVNIKTLVEYLFNYQNKSYSNQLLCWTMQTYPIRDLKSKYFISTNDYSQKIYPPYCQGCAIIMSPDVPKRLLAASKYAPFVWIGDVYAYGFLPWVSGIRMTQPHNFKILLNATQGTIQKKYMFYLLPSEFFIDKDLEYIWNKLK